jgi:phosphoserine aminotransferase
MHTYKYKKGDESMKRKYNFNAGPSTLPLPVLQQVQEEMVDYHGTGLSLIEASHRNKVYDEVHNETISLIGEMLNLPANYKTLFLGGGATLQFSMIPLNFLGSGKSCDFTLTGTWAKKAYDDSKKIGNVNVLFDGAKEKYTSLPPTSSIKTDPDSAYLHLTSNETIQGVQWKEWPDSGKVPLIVDMSSDIMSRSIPVEKFGLIYAGAQKNLGPAGVTVVIMREDLLEKASNNLTAYLSYKIHAEENSLYNTPPVFSIYCMNLVLKWLKASGGMEGVEKRTSEKSSLIYDAIEKSGGFYKCPVSKNCRSLMNVVFTLPKEEMDKKFIEIASAEGMIGLKGHRSVGGCRASIYNAMPIEGAKALAELMMDFAKKNG